MQQFLSIFQRLKIQTRLVAYSIAFAVMITGLMVIFAYHQTVEILQTAVDQETALALARQIAVSLGVIGVLLSILLIAAVVIVAKRITAPLGALRETVFHITDGELTASAPVFSDDEVGALSQAFNAMTEKLRQTLAGLESELKERKQAEEKLLQFRRVMDESSDAIFLIDLESGCYIDFNRIAHEFLGYSRQELAQLTVMDVAQHLPNLDRWLERVQLPFFRWKSAPVSWSMLRRTFWWLLSGMFRVVSRPKQLCAKARSVFEKYFNPVRSRFPSQL